MSISPLTKMAVKANIHDLVVAATAVPIAVGFGVAGSLAMANNASWYVTALFLFIALVAVAGIYPPVRNTLSDRSRLDAYYRIPQEDRHRVAFPIPAYRPGR